jgi:lipoprotein-anchoring transpeptidase ErfK/SrfK
MLKLMPTGGPAGVRLAATSLPNSFAIASVLPTRGEVVGVAHPVVVTFSRPVADRHAAERALEVKSAPAMTASLSGSTATLCSGFPTDSGRRTAQWHFRWAACRRTSKQVQSSSGLPISQITRSP